MKETCDQKLRNHQARRAKTSTEDPMGDIESEPTISEAPTVNMTAATPVSPPQKKRRMEHSTTPVNFNVQSEAKEDTNTPQSERTSANRSSFSGPDNGPHHISTPEAEIISLHLERDFDSNSATMETKIQHTIHMNDVQAQDEVRDFVGDWFHEFFNFDATEEYEM